MNTNLTTTQWWRQSRKHYNASLVVAGIAAFLCYAIIVFAHQDVIVSVEITLFTTFFQGLGYLIMMGIANLCFFAGPISERVVRPKKVDRYRKTVYRIGYWFSVLLPFGIPALMLYIVLFHPEYGSIGE